ncbi:Aste57867_21348 [Aphanomyces stellatus]|uniref:Aste57867_21348 protein n=1 Tax=Aphanomyces stellatus TaxID=120398 RepID=A0A485LLV1_9STRA|nr:hypothetical protein As57867_021279 [Aphanomyces stellatus]VFT98020.1 Aste57867_21348 [Aphanomyces stellatus]
MSAAASPAPATPTAVPAHTDVPAIAVATTTTTAPVVASITPTVVTVCKADVKQCKKDGGAEIIELSRDPNNFCAFPVCPAGWSIYEQLAPAPTPSTSTAAAAAAVVATPVQPTAAPTATATAALPASADPTAAPTTPAAAAATTTTVVTTTTTTVAPPTTTTTAAPVAITTTTTVAPVAVLTTTGAPIVTPEVTVTQVIASVLPSTTAAASSSSPVSIWPSATPTSAAVSTTTTTAAPTTTAAAVMKPAQPYQPPQEAQWVGIDDAHTPELEHAALDAFATYRAPDVCSALKVTLISFEMMTGLIPSAGRQYSIVAKVNCNAEESGADGKYILHFSESPVNTYHLSMCGHVKSSIVTNWISVENGTAVCQNPAQNTDFSLQKETHVEHSSAIYDYYQRLEHGDTTAIVLGVLGLLAAAVVVSAMVMLRNRFRYHQTSLDKSPSNKVGDDGDDDEESKVEDDDDEDVELAKTKDNDEVVLNEPDTTTTLKATMKLDTPGAGQEAKFTIE